MNENILLFMMFFLVLVVLYWIIPTEKGNAITHNLKSLLQVFPVSQIVRAYLDYLKSTKQ